MKRNVLFLLVLAFSSLFPYAIGFLDLDGNLLESVRLSVMLGIETGTISKIIFNLKGIKEKKKIKYVKISHYLNSNNPDLSEFSGEISLIVEDLGESKSARIVKDDKTILECK